MATNHAPPADITAAIRGVVTRLLFDPTISDEDWARAQLLYPGDVAACRDLAARVESLYRPLIEATREAA